ncbi:MAG TPA: cytochrome P450 [Ktedonobacteraceae bacterium]|nr:cytochrome P450 [Ktedonobacteraceae bacterium]
MATTMNDQQTRAEKAELPPGPRKLPYLGNLLELRRDPPGYLQQLQRTYGDMATIHFGKQPVVLLFRPEYVRYVLVEHPRSFVNSSFAGGPNDDSSAANEGLLTINGEKHRQQRRAVQSAFHKKRVEGYATIMREYTQELLDGWQAGETVDMSQAMQEVTLRIVSKCLFSIDLSNQLRPLSGAFNGFIASQSSVVEDLLNIRIDNPITGYGRRMAAMRQLNTLVYTLIAQRRDNPSGYDDVLAMLMEATSGEEPETKLTEKQIHDHVITFLAAGHETTAVALVWTFYLLAQYPEVREKLLEELRTVLAGRAPTVEDIAKLPYLDWVLSESMRLYPPAWMQVRFTAGDVELGGVNLPKGTMLIVSQWVLHRLPEIWGDAEIFRPERWDPVNGQQVPPGAYFPFGGGPRTCIGMPFAQLEAKLILATILQRYTPQPVSGYTPGLLPVITLRPKHNLRTILIPTVSGSNGSSNAWRQLVPAPNSTVQERRGCLTALLGLFGV